MITLEQYFMGRDKTHNDELTEEIKEAATVLVERVNALLEQLEISRTKVTSGWRPAAINKKIGGAKSSNHMTGHAVDLSDPDKSIAKTLIDNGQALIDNNLWLEHPAYTKTWVHLQSKPPKSGKYIFIP